MKKRVGGFRLGDTLVEVALAIGIFSMVAIAVISVISSSTSSAQSTLETTVTREAIDAQAEALRFLQSAYIAGGENGTSNNSYAKIWKAITDLADKNINDPSAIEYAPTTCAANYEGNKLFNQGAFVINTQKINTLDPSQIVVTTDKVEFTEAATYPRLVYSSRAASPDETILGQDTGEILRKAEGIYIVAVKDAKDTYLVNGDSISKGSAYYDFYIRTCWYTPGAEIPSTISTVIRLYDPDVMPARANIKFDANGGEGTMNTQSAFAGSSIKLLSNKFIRDGYIFNGWCVDATSCASPIPNRGTYELPSGHTNNKTVTMYAQWRESNYMQDITKEICRDYASSANYTVRDRRDNHEYTIRYIDGDCWMTADLDIKNIITSEDSNFSGEDMININSGDGNDHYFPDATNIWMVPISGLTNSDYNFCAATALQGCEPDKFYDDEGDICPAGWHIPTNANIFEDAAPLLSLGQNGYWTTKNSDMITIPVADIEGYSMKAIVLDEDEGWIQKDVPRSEYLGIRCILKD